MSRSQTVYHRDFEFAETYEKLALALGVEKESQQPSRLRVRDVRPLGAGRYRLDVVQQDLLAASPREGWAFRVTEQVSGQLARVEPQHSYVTVRCDSDLTALGIREIWLKPHDFLASLRRWVERQSGPVPLAPSLARPSTPLTHSQGLRDRQRQAVEAVGPGQTFLWGPPGTGKTYTVGRLVLALLQQGFQVLLLAPTNIAVDLAILSVDDAATALGAGLEHGEVLRAGQPQLEQLESRTHLMAWQQKQAEVQKQLTALKQRRARLKRTLSQETRPTYQRQIDPELEACEAELKQLETHRQRHLWALVSQAKVLGCTVHSSFQRQEITQFCQTSKLAIVYDEAGMVPRFALVPLLALLRGEEAPCGNLDRIPEQVAFAFSGDPKQLSPIANPPRNDVNSNRWLLESLMETLPPETVMLDEQSRMDPQICRVVSDNYYHGKLRTLDDPTRHAIPLVQEWPREGILLVDPQRSIYLPLDDRERPVDLAKTRTFNEKAVRLGALLIRWALDQGKTRDVLWLTPFRQQTQRLMQATRLLFDSFEEESIVRAGTVHSAQGSQADLVVFDPVAPNHPWLQEPALCDRLINVAISRARTQVLVLASRNQIRKAAPFWNALHACTQYHLEGTPDAPRFVRSPNQ